MARFISDRPAPVEPVNPPALISGCCTSAAPTEVPAPKMREKTPSGKPQARTLFRTASPTSWLVPGCAEWAFTITGFPAANAEAVSPPATEKASGKLLAENTTTGPSGRSSERMPGFGKGLRFGSGRSMRA